MKQLVSIRLVQFFLYERLDVRIGDISGIFGPNGSGKSSLLDAVQIGMFGANMRLTSFNAQADENQSNTRSVRSYCLGQYGDSENERVRDRATTYITLVWRDSDTNETVSMGVCLYAGIESDGHEVLGRYLLRGVELSMGDHLDLVDGRETPREWNTFRHQLQERSKVSGEDPLFNESERYVRAMLVALRGSGGMPQYDAFTRAFRFALRMRFDRPVDQIVRFQVLEARPTNIKKFKEVTESFRRLAAMVADVEAKITQAQDVEKDYARADEESRKSVAWKALASVARQEQAQEALDQADVAEQTARGKSIEASNTFAAKQEAATHASGEADRLKLLKEQHSAHAESGALQSQIDEKRQSGKARSTEIRGGAARLRQLVREAAEAEFIQGSTAALRACLPALDTLVQGGATFDRDVLRTKLQPALRAVNAALSELFESRRQIGNDLQRAQQALDDAKADVERGRDGRSPLSPEVRRLVSELRDAGLNPTPVCDLVRVTDPRWQPVIESYLGSNVQALLVAESEEAKAFTIYRGLTGGRAVFGAKIARESRFLARRSPAAGSVAELLDGSHPAAVNYLRSKFGNATRANTNEESLASVHSLTVDGMLVGDGEIDRKQLVSPRNFRLGGVSPEQLADLNAEITRLTSEVSRIATRDAQAKNLFEMLQIFGGEKDVLARVLSVYDEMRSAAEAVSSLTRRLEDSASAEYVSLVEQEAEWRTRANELLATISEFAEAKGRAHQHLESCSEALASCKLVAGQVALEVQSAKAAMGFDADTASRYWDTLLAQYGVDYAQMHQHCVKQDGLSKRREEAAANSGNLKLGQFLQAHREHVARDVLADWRECRNWILELLHRLNETTLQDYKEQMEVAYRTSQATFRNDVALALHENLKWLELTQDRLNDVLRTCPVFSNGERYRFKRTVRPAYQPLLKFIKGIAEMGSADDLFGGPGEMPEQFRALLEEKTAPGAAGSKSPLDDYREFFEFDIEIFREDAESRVQRTVGHLSKRLGSGSGGEHRAPLYVIAGAALASAYRLENGKRDGIRLILLDEAFNKMDMGNIIATMRYLEDLGLQVLMASPGENLGTLTAFLDRYFDILRDAERNVLRLQGHDVSAETRAMFREDLPEFNPDLVAGEIMSMTATDVSGRLGLD